MALDFVNIKPAIQAHRQISDDLRQHNVSRIVLSPNRWATYQQNINFNWILIKFNKDNVNKIPDDKYGIYSFVVDPGIANHPRASSLLYIGKAQDQSLRKRITQYFHEPDNPKGRPPIQNMLIDWPDHLYVCFTVVDKVEEIENIEDALLNAFVPPINQTFKGELGKAVRAWRAR
jgi:hypothetical protein